jgi:hypothetical protein
MSINPATLSTSIQNTDHYSLNLQQRKTRIRITMKLFGNVVNTKTIPHTVKILKKALPSVLHTQCFNDEGLPFVKEVKKTEIGHLFEHILLEYLCLLKLASGRKIATFKGNTNWNWERDTWGTFHITINAGEKDAHLMPQAMDASIKLLNSIIHPPSYMRITEATKS